MKNVIITGLKTSWMPLNNRYPRILLEHFEHYTIK